LDELQKLENEYGVVMEDSPTLNAGSRVLKEQKKITHEHPMLSLGKIHSVEEIKKFIGDKDVIASVKMDGLSLSCTYLNGNLTRLETRGNGTQGTDVMVHKNGIDGLSLHIKHNGKYVVDGECIVKYDDFQAINDKLPEDEQFSNPRNMASGSLNLLDSNISSTRGLTFVVWNVIEDSEDFKPTMLGNLVGASGLGFDVVPFVKVDHNDDEELDNILTTMKYIADKRDFPMDGVVFSYNDIAYGKSLGRTEKFFRNAVAYKYEDEDVETTLTGIDWTLGKTGVLTPTAEFQTVSIEGSEVSRASLHNISICKSLELGVGDKILVHKSNLIIPQVRENLTRSNTFEIPTHCPICDGKTKIVKENESEVLMCTNPNCKGKLLGKLTHFTSKNAANIAGLSEQTLQFLLDRGWVNTFKDIYKLDWKRTIWKEYDGFGHKSVDKLLDNIEKSRNIDLSHFLYSLSIPLIGKTASKDIAKECNDDFQTFVHLICSKRENAFINIDGFGSEMNKSLLKWWDENNEEFLKLSNEFCFEEKENNNVSDIDLSGKTFVITGSLVHYKNRNELVKIIENLGGKVSGSVSAKTSYLVCNEISNSKKCKEAKKYNIPIITEEELIKLINKKN
jgi:DNA ligase (NAD+)